MDCTSPSETASTPAALSALVAELRESGATSVLVGVVGRGAGALRSVVPNVRTLAAPDDASLDAVAGTIFAAPGRCVVVARREDVGWSWVVTAGSEPVGLVEVPPPRPEPPKRPPEGAFQAGLGIAAGVYPCEADFLPTHPETAASPMAFVAAELSMGPVHVFVGVDSAPTYVYACSVELYPLAMGTVGVWFGDDAGRIGPYGSFGLIASEIGVRAAFTPWGAGHVRHGIEVRLGGIGSPTQPILGGPKLAVAWR